MHKYKSYVLGALCTATLACTAITAPSAQSKPEQARSASSFVDSIGVNTHLNYTDTVYYRNFTNIIKPRLQELGVRHIRDGGFHSEEYFNRLRELSRIGIKSTLIFTGTPPGEVIDIVRTLKGAIVAVEGPNESDLEHFNFSYKGQKFPEGTRNYQKELYTAINSNSDTKNLPVLMPSMGWGENANKLGYLAWGDICNMHSYTNKGERPTYDIDWYFMPNARTICGNKKPMMSTETGYHNMVSDDLGISESSAGKYIPRLLLENFNRGIKRTYLYELINLHPDPKNTDKENHYGLLRNDGSRKPAFQATRNLIALLKDSNTPFRPSSLNYTMTGNMQELHRTLLQKRDGTFYLILWQDAKSWDNQRKKDATVSNRNIKVTLNSSVSQATVYQPLKSTKPVSQATSRGGRVRELLLSVPDHPLVVRLVPARGKT